MYSSKPYDQFLRLARKVTYTSLGMALSFKKPHSHVYILCYHSIDHPTWRFSIYKETIQRHIAYVKKFADFITLHDISNFLEGKKFFHRPSVAITFDDGFQSIYKLKNFFEAQKIYPTVFVLSNPKDADWQELDNDERLLTDNELIELSNVGWEIGCHSATHQQLKGLSHEKLEKEIIQSKEQLEQRLNIPVNYFAYPRNYVSWDIKKIVARAGYTMAVTLNSDVVKPATNLLLIPRINIDRTINLHEFRALLSKPILTAHRIIHNLIIPSYG